MHGEPLTESDLYQSAMINIIENDKLLAGEKSSPAVLKEKGKCMLV